MNDRESTTAHRHRMAVDAEFNLRGNGSVLGQGPPEAAVQILKRLGRHPPMRELARRGGAD